MSTNKRFLFVITALIFIILGISGGLLNIAWTYMQVTFDVSVGAIGVILLFATTGSLIAALASGTLIGRFGLGSVATLAVMIVALGLIGVGISPTWFALMAIIFFMYMGRGMLDAALNNFVSENYGTTAMNWLHASWGLGLTIAPPIMTVILLNFGWTWRSGYLIMAVVMFLLGILVLFNRNRWEMSEQEATGSSAETVPRASAWEALQRPVVLWSVAFFFIYGGVEIGIGQLVNTLFVQSRNIPQELSSLWISLYWGSFTVGRIVLGVIALRLGEKLLLRASLFLVLLGASLLTLNSLQVINMAAVLLLGSGLAGIFPSLISQTPRRVSRRLAAQTIGFQIGFAGFGGAILPGIIGFISENAGLEFIAYGIFVNTIALVLIYMFLAGRYPVTEKPSSANST